MLAKTRVLQFIDSTFDEIHTALASEPQGEVCIKLSRLTGVANRPSQDESDLDMDGDAAGRGQRKRRATSRVVKYAWPGNSESEGWRFTCLITILHEIHCALQADIVVTKRDIYYRHVELFQKQETVDRFIDDIAFTCGVTRHDLNVTASPKSLICGINFAQYPAMLDQHPRIHLVPTDPSTITSALMKHIRWVLIIEKEASFKTLVEAEFDKKCTAGPGLLMTTKGYPDLNSWLFLQHLSKAHLPLFSCTDSDPDGITIHQCYTHPPRSLAGSEQHITSLPITRLGVDIADHLSDLEVMNRSLPLTKRDRTRARTMLSHTTDKKLKSSLQTMLLLGLKMEIQAIDLIPWLNKSLSYIS